MLGRVVAALIVIGVIAFLAIDAYILYRYFQSRRTANQYASFAVPGEATVTVPAGKLKLTYQESYTATGGGDGPIDFGVPAALQVQVTDASAGDELEIKGVGFKGMGSSVDVSPGKSRAKIGTVEITEAGSYRVTAGPAIEGGIEPQILVGT
jgi:hypothetical protein